jgi:hypothetical protein
VSSTEQLLVYLHGFFFFNTVLGVKPRTFCRLGKCSDIGLHPQLYVQAFLNIPRDKASKPIALRGKCPGFGLGQW